MFLTDWFGSKQQPPAGNTPPPAAAHEPAAPAAGHEPAQVAAAPDGAQHQPVTAQRSTWDIIRGRATDFGQRVVDGANTVGNRVMDGVNTVRESINDAIEHHQQVKAAEASREQLEAKIAKLGDLKPEQRARILARTQGLSGDELIQEMAVLDNALGGKNADRALSTYADLDKMAADSKKAGERLNSDVIGQLVTGVANSRTDSDRGQAGILGQRQARESAQTLIDMSDEDYKSTQALLDQAGKGTDGKVAPGADVAAEQALILKAVAARQQHLSGAVESTVDPGGGGQTPNQKANCELAQFARDIRGMKRDDLIQSTTLIDVDDRNTSTTDPEKARGGDTKTDNDGLFQRFTTTCGPTTAQMVRGEADPAYALRLRQDHFNDNDPTSEYAQEQKKMLEANGGVAVSRLGQQELTATNEKLEELRKSKQLSNADYLQVKKLMAGNGKGKLAKSTQTALEHLRAKNDGHPTDAELHAMQEDHGKHEAGMVLSPALNGIAGDQTHINYSSQGTSGTSGPSTAELTNVDTALKDGQDVPIRIGGSGNSGHFMMVSDVRGEPGKDRKYLVSDPWSGATRWVSEADFQSGKFTTTTFDLGNAGVTHLYG